MKFFLDTEFMEDGRTIELLSLALVCEDGREFYAVNSLADTTRANEFVRDSVLPHLLDDVGCSALITAPFFIRSAVLDFVRLPAADDPRYGELRPEFWGYYADYDWVAFCQLFGRMIDLPGGFPMYCRDIKQFCDWLGNPILPQQGNGEHHALQDARWNRSALKFLEDYYTAEA